MSILDLLCECQALRFLKLFNAVDLRTMWQINRHLRQAVKETIADALPMSTFTVVFNEILEEVKAERPVLLTRANIKSEFIEFAYDFSSCESLRQALEVLLKSPFSSVFKRSPRRIIFGCARFSLESADGLEVLAEYLPKMGGVVTRVRAHFRHLSPELQARFRDTLNASPKITEVAMCTNAEIDDLGAFLEGLNANRLNISIRNATGRSLWPALSAGFSSVTISVGGQCLHSLLRLLRAVSRGTPIATKRITVTHLCPTVAHFITILNFTDRSFPKMLSGLRSPFNQRAEIAALRREATGRAVHKFVLAHNANIVFRKFLASTNGAANTELCHKYIILDVNYCRY